MNTIHASILTSLLVLNAAFANAQDSTFNASHLGPEFADYSHLDDTVLVVYGNCAMGGMVFEESTNASFGMNFARRELTIRNGKLKKMMVFDSNSGYRTTTHYGPWNMVWVRHKYVMATNAPHPEL